MPRIKNRSLDAFVMFLLFGFVLQDADKLQSGKKPSLLTLNDKGLLLSVD